jgi:hypothetical protein
MASTPRSATQPSQAAAPDGVDISAPRARQAYRGRRVLWILLASLALVVAAFFVAFATNPTTPVDEKAGNARTNSPAAAEIFHAPEPAPKQPG